jgi:hypothetical protein
MTFEESLRSWPEAELRQGADDPQFGPEIRAESERRAQPCTCFVPLTVSHERWRERRRECERHRGRS